MDHYHCFTIVNAASHASMISDTVAFRHTSCSSLHQHPVTGYFMDFASSLKRSRMPLILPVMTNSMLLQTYATSSATGETKLDLRLHLHRDLQHPTPTHTGALHA